MAVKKKQRIGLLGGTFNPIHLGHMAIAQKALEACSLDKVIFIPNSAPPHKVIRNLAAPEHRYRMIQAAIEDCPDFEVTDLEIKRGGKSYTVDTVRHFRDTCPVGTKFYFIMGEDCLPQLGAWKDVNEILGIVTFVVVHRPGIEPRHEEIPHRTVMMPGLDISSSYLRRRMAEGKTIKYLVPEPVFRYIESHQLY